MRGTASAMIVLQYFADVMLATAQKRNTKPNQEEDVVSSMKDAFEHSLESFGTTTVISID